MMAARITQIPAFTALTQMLVMPPFFLSGALYPLRSLPAWLSVLTRFDPITYAVYPMRDAVFGHLNISSAASADLSPAVRWDGWACRSASSRCWVSGCSGWRSRSSSAPSKTRFIK